MSGRYSNDPERDAIIKAVFARLGYLQWQCNLETLDVINATIDVMRGSGK
jgi:hypothetical protein